MARTPFFVRYFGALLTSPSWQKIGIVYKVFSEKVSALTRMRQKRVTNASEMRQNLFQNGSFFFYLGKEESSKMRQHASKMRQKCQAPKKGTNIKNLAGNPPPRPPPRDP